MHPCSFQASGSSGHGAALVPGEYGVAKSFLGLLTRSDVCAGLHESFTMLCVRVCVSDASVWYLGLFALCVILRLRTWQLLGPSALSVHGLVLLVVVGEFGSFGSSMRVLMISCMSPAVFACPPSVSVFLSPLMEEGYQFSQALPRPIP